ncbi:hypothetical protein FP026_12810 [Rhizobium tropici]|uniref:DUF6161 domain-containing protein n=1 Tax=Rhizobium tropici TaxID=398 RepID=A0A5B0W2G4_RHITR|nr:DUF6161 domain-containing protein [Rhizobium tropici]KAA1181200.1 hypothetical protein FP026_12810 [Rhizobium tropici]
MIEQAITWECRSQGIGKTTLEPNELIPWLNDEMAFWRDLPGIDQDYVSANRNYGSPGIAQGYQRRIGAILSSLRDNDASGFNSFIQAAEEQKAVLSKGKIGQQIARLIAEQQLHSAQMLALVFSEGVVTARAEIKEAYGLLKIVLQFNPNVATTADIVSASESLRIASNTATSMKQARLDAEVSLDEMRDAFAKYVDEKTRELNDLHELYEKHLVLQGPSRHWQKVASTANRYAFFALVAFVVLLAAPALLIALEWSAVSGYIDHVLDITKGTISVASLVVFTVPVLAYGWLLKHVSRIFAQNLLIASDAEHRRVMAITFLGLAKRKSVGIAEQDRALILNALFRPAPTSPQEEGPPLGLLEFIKK